MWLKTIEVHRFGLHQALKHGARSKVRASEAVWSLELSYRKHSGNTNFSQTLSPKPGYLWLKVPCFVWELPSSSGPGLHQGTPSPAETLLDSCVWTVCVSMCSQWRAVCTQVFTMNRHPHIKISLRGNSSVGLFWESVWVISVLEIIF